MFATMKAKKAMKGKSSVRKVKAKKTRKAMKAMKARTGKTSMKVMKAMHVHDGCEDLARHAVSDEGQSTEYYEGYEEDLARPPESHEGQGRHEDEVAATQIDESDEDHDGHEGHEGHEGLPAMIAGETSEVSSEDYVTPTDRDFGSKRKRVNDSFRRRSRPTHRDISSTRSDTS